MRVRIKARKHFVEVEEGRFGLRDDEGLDVEEGTPAAQRRDRCVTAPGSRVVRHVVRGFLGPFPAYLNPRVPEIQQRNGSWLETAANEIGGPAPRLI